MEGGEAPYIYDWGVDGKGDWDDPQELHSMVEGLFQVTVRDQNECEQELVFQAEFEEVSILTANDGFVEAL